MLLGGGATEQQLLIKLSFYVKKELTYLIKC